MWFSEREGFKPVRQALQVESVDDPLLNGLWNLLTSDILQHAHIGAYGEWETANFYDLVWAEYFKKREDQKPPSHQALHSEIESAIFDGEWYEIYDFIEFVLQNFRFDVYYEGPSQKGFAESCNYYLEREASAYRVVGQNIVRIISDTEIAAVEHASSFVDRYAPVATHITRSLELLSDRKQPDYRNSIKEAISAVEAMCAIITNKPKATLGGALKQLEANGVAIHPALMGAFNQMYGYTSDANGIRHGLGLTEEPTLNFETAKFMLVSCSAFVNLLRSRIGQ